MASTHYSTVKGSCTYTTLNSCSMSLKFNLYKHTLTIKEIKSVLPVQSSVINPITEHLPIIW